MTDQVRYGVALATLALMFAVPEAISAEEGLTPWKFRDIQGKTHRPFEDESIEAIVLVFIATDCPIANSYQPKLGRLAKRYNDRGVRMYLVHPRPELDVQRAQQHAQDFDIQVPVVIDKQLQITRRAGATVTPQAFVFVRDQKVAAYQGRIDNLYANYGKKRRAATTDELANALEAVVSGEDVEVPKTKSIGCIIPNADPKAE